MNQEWVEIKKSNKFVQKVSVVCIVCNNFKTSNCFKEKYCVKSWIATTELSFRIH